MLTVTVEGLSGVTALVTATLSQPQVSKEHRHLLPWGNMTAIADQIEEINHALTAKELAALLSVSPISIYKLARSKRIPHVRIGACVRFCGKSVAQWLRNQEIQTSTGKAN